MMTGRFIKKHVFLVTTCMICLSGLFLLGYALSRSPQFADFFSRLPDKNNGFLILWRCAFYLSLFLLWIPFCRYVICRETRIHIDKGVNKALIHSKKYRSLVNFRYRIVVMALFYELIFVQNIIRWML